MTTFSEKSLSVMLEKAQSALKAGDKKTARTLAQKVIAASPDNVDAYLMLASLSTPTESLSYLKRVLEIDPKNQKAREKMHLLVEQLKEEEIKRTRRTSQEETQAIRASASKEGNKRKNARSLGGGILSAIGVVLITLFIFIGDDLSWPSTPQKNGRTMRPAGVLLKPTLTPSATATPIPTFTPTDSAATSPTSTGKPTADKTYLDYFAHSWDIPDAFSNADAFWIEVDLSEQMVYTYKGDTFLKSFLVSTGTNTYPTITGAFKIYAKYPSYLMVGDGYYLPNVPYSMFFYKGYSLHGTYWHNNFGTPMSHGCINMKTSDAKWVYENTPIGTYVYIHD